jgi:hypothetical protein
MRRLTLKRWISLLLAAALVFAMVPLSPVQAAVSFTFDGLSTDENSPTQVNSDTIEVKGSYFGVATDTITYEVVQIVNGQEAAKFSGVGVSPLLTGTNNFTFSNVKLFEGLNKITVSGNASGSLQANSAYVFFPNMPTIYEISLTDGRTLLANKPTLVASETIALMFRAPNATNVTVQGKPAYSGGGDVFLISDIEVNPGLNTLVFVASNATKTYTITREVVRLYDLGSTVYDVSIDNNSGTPTKVKLDGFPTVGSNLNNDTLSGTISGKIVLPVVANTTPSFDIEVTRQSNGLPVAWSNSATSVAAQNITKIEDLSVTGATYEYAVYSFTTGANTITFTDSDQYRVQMDGQFGPIDIDFGLSFNYRKNTSPYFTEVKQLYNVTETSTTGVYNYGSSSKFTNGLSFFQAPIWLGVTLNNFDPANHAIVIESVQNGAANPSLTYEVNGNNAANYYKSTNGEYLFKITNFPAGEQTLTLRAIDKSNGNAVEDTATFDITYIPTPFIHLTNIQDGKIFTSENDFKSTNASTPVLTGKLINFNLTPSGGGLPDDLKSLAITINGTTIRADNDPQNRIGFVTSGGAYTGEFTFQNYGDDNLYLVNGPNTIIVTANNGGVPVSTHITVYLFPGNVPQVTTITPVPVGQATDANNLFQNNGTSELTYSTTERAFEVLFSVVNASQVVVTIDGQTQPYATSTKSGSAFNDSAQLTFLGSGANGTANFRLLYVPPVAGQPSLQLPETGTKSVTIMAVAGTTTSSKTLQITRVRVPYKIKSPLLPQERVINQNFITVSIEAEGADSITIGKEEMIKGSDGLFRLELTDLKKGENRIKFTITTGNTKTNGEFSITYADQNEVGAQYKTTMPSSGKLNLFNGALTLSFPKGTLLKQPQTVNQINAPQIDLFNGQKLLFGIADKQDGRTLKRYNRVGEIANNVPQDGNLATISADPYATSLLSGSRQHFGFASELFWIDAGYFDGTSNQYKTVDGLHPYATSNNGSDRFFNRNASKWLVPTQRGTITLKYDPSIRNEIAQNLSIWRFSDNTWHNIGGVVNTSNKTVTASFDGFGYYAVMSLRYGFDDITGHDYARNHLNTMFAKGIMTARSNSVFGVYENITRGEFATMVVKILDLPLNYAPESTSNFNQLTFNDVPAANVPNALWDYRYIETAARAGIISGVGPRQFAPNAYLTREQAAVIIARAMNYKLGTPEKDRESLAKQFTDAGTIDYYAVSHVQAVVKAKIMQGQKNTVEGQSKATYSFNPKSYLNRADMAIIAYNLMSNLKRL